MKPFTAIAVCLFALILLVHLVSAITSTEIDISGTSIPVWISVLAAVFSGGLSYTLWREAKGL